MKSKRSKKAPAKRSKKRSNKAPGTPKGSNELPANVKSRPDLPPPHTGRPVRGCTCVLCRMHRYLDRQAARDHAAALIHEMAVGPVTVTLAKNASQALREALGG